MAQTYGDPVAPTAAGGPTARVDDAAELTIGSVDPGDDLPGDGTVDRPTADPLRLADARTSPRGGDPGDPGDAAPGDGTVDGAPPGEADALRATATRGREARAARANLADDVPLPRETPAD